MASLGAGVAFASGRIGSSMRQFLKDLDINVAMLTLNGAAVYLDQNHGSRVIYDAPLQSKYADYLISYSAGKDFAVNYYLNEKLYAGCGAGISKWTGLYHQETASAYNLVDSLDCFLGNKPSKVIFVGDPEELDKEEVYFRNLWGESVYICRTWDYYLEFLNVNANKGIGLQMLANSYGVGMDRVVAFGDAANDIPMLQAAGLGIAVGNADTSVKNVADKVSDWTNDEDAIAKEWEIIKSSTSL